MSAFCQEIDSNFPSVSLDAPNSLSYKVIQGDTLYSIAKKFNVTVDDLKRENNILDNSVEIGRLLTIPGKPYGQPMSQSENEVSTITNIEDGTYFPYYSIKPQPDGKVIKDSKNIPHFIIWVKVDKVSKKIKISFFEDKKKINEDIFQFNKLDNYIINDKVSGDKIRIKNFPPNYILVEYFSKDGSYLGGVVLLKSQSS